jgi:hypothetical protein
MDAAHKSKLTFPTHRSLSPEQREAEVRASIARKESICPYAPGLAQFVHLPEIDTLKMEHVYYLAKELKSFYDAKEKGKRVGRWMLMPHKEWESHEEAHSYSENMFWLLNAAYFHLVRDKKSVHAALNKDLPGYDRGHNGEILVPIIGKQPKRGDNVIPAKSLFYSALSPLYKSKQFYRYSPHCIIPLVYASEFEELRLKHPKVTENVTFEMAYVGLYETFGETLNIDLTAFRSELPIWGSIIDRVAAIMRAKATNTSSLLATNQGCPSTNLLLFRQCSPELIKILYSKYMSRLKVLSSLVMQTSAHPATILGASFAGSGLYVIPEYAHRS